MGSCFTNGYIADGNVVFGYDKDDGDPQKRRPFGRNLFVGQGGEAKRGSGGEQPNA